MTQIVVFPRGQLTTQDKKALRAAGVVPVEADNPKDVVVVIPLADGADLLTPSDLLLSALKAVSEGGEGTRFIGELYRRVKHREESAAATPGSKTP